MLSPSVCYAAKALAHLWAEGGRTVAVHEIAEATGIPHAYLAKIIQQLARQRLIVTQRGVGGGVGPLPGRDLSEITLYDLCVALGDPIVEIRCLIGEEECSDERACPAHEFWSPQRERLLTFLRTTAVDQVARFEARSGGGGAP